MTSIRTGRANESEAAPTVRPGVLGLEVQPERAMSVGQVLVAGLMRRVLVAMRALRWLSYGGRWASDCDHVSGRALQGLLSSAAEGVPEVDEFWVVGRQGYVDG